MIAGRNSAQISTLYFSQNKTPQNQNNSGNQNRSEPWYNVEIFGDLISQQSQNGAVPTPFSLSTIRCSCLRRQLTLIRLSLLVCWHFQKRGDDIPYFLFPLIYALSPFEAPLQFKNPPQQKKKNVKTYLIRQFAHFF